jgi:hypothetical protein
MKNLSIPAFLFTGVILFYSCKKNDPAPSTADNNIVPKQFSIPLPSSLASASASNGRIEGTYTAENDTVYGQNFYGLLRGYIWFGAFSAATVEGIMKAIGDYKLSQATNISFISNDDHRIKNLIVIETATFESVMYKYKLTIKDSLTHKIGLQIFWNTSPVSGVAILKPYDLNKTTAAKDSSVVYRVDYTEVASDKYDKTMLVQASGVATTGGDLNTIKMFVGSKGDVLSVYGNSNHPNVADLSLGGINFAFRAKANKTHNVSSAEVALPPNTLIGITTLYTDYSFKNVFIAAVKKVYPTISSNDIAKYIKNAEAPAFFKSGGFVSAGTSPTADGTLFDDVKDLSGLEPYVPNDIKNLSVEFAK